MFPTLHLFSKSLQSHLNGFSQKYLLFALVEHNGSPITTSPANSGTGTGELKRFTKETNVSVKINLDGSGVAASTSGIPFLDHMLYQFISHGLLDVHVRASGDIHIDDHHTNEDVALAIGMLVEHFFQSLVNTSGMTLTFCRCLQVST